MNAFDCSYLERHDYVEGAGGENLKETKPVDAELLIGPYRSGKTLNLVEQVIEQARKHPFEETIVLVPSQRYQQLFEKRLARALASGTEGGAERGIFGLRIVSFYKLCQIILRRSGRTFKVIPEQVRPAVIAQVLSELSQAEQLKSIAPIVEFTGTYQALLDLVDEFERAALSGGDVVRRLEKTAQFDSRYMELARVYESYLEKLVQLGFVDEKGLAFACREALYAEPASGSGSGEAPGSASGSVSGSLRQPFGLIAVDGFDRFNPLQLHVLAGLARHCRKLEILFDYVAPEQDHDGEYAWKESSYNDLIGIIGNNLKVREIASDRGPLAQTKQSGKPQLSRFRAIDRQLEMEEIARRIKEKIVRENASPDRFLVVARDLKAYSALAQAAFESAGLNYFIDQATPLTALPMVQLIVKLLSLASADFKRFDVISCLRSTYFDAGAFAFAPISADLLDRLSYERQVVSGRQQWQQIFPDSTEGAADASEQSLRTSLFALFDHLTPPQEASVSDYVAWAENVLEKCLKVFETADQIDALEEAAALREVQRCLAGLIQEETILKKRSVTTTPERFLARLNHLIERRNLRRQPRADNAVLICGADLAPNRTFDEVFIAGMVEGQFPKRASQRGFLTADEVERWRRFQIDILNPRYQPGFELALFSSLVDRAAKICHLSYPISEMTGEELTPSFLMTEGLAEGVRLEDALTNIEPFAKSQKEPLSARDALAGVLWFSDSQSILSGAFTDVRLQSLREKIAEPLSVAVARAATAPGSAGGSFNGYLVDHVIAGAVSVELPEIWSASALSEYGKCPFRYWMSRVLRCDLREEPEAKLPVNVLGDTYHKAMELFYREMIAAGLDLAESDVDACRAVFDKAVEEALAWLTARPDVRTGEFWQYERNEIIFRLNRFFESERLRALTDKEAYAPALVEASFGEGKPGSYKALEIEDGGKKILLRGRIDRVDVAKAAGENGVRQVRIVDYKSGSKRYTVDDALSGREMQLPLYALAVQRSILGGSRVTEGQYLSISSGESTGRLSFDLDKPARRSKKSESEDDAPPPDHLAIVEVQTRQIVARIASGDFSVSPSSKSVCDHCDHRVVCRIDELARSGDRDSDFDSEFDASSGGDAFSFPRGNSGGSD